VAPALRLLLVSILLLSAGGQVRAETDTSSPERLLCQSPFSVGFKVVDIRQGPKMAVWYPTSDPESRFQYFPDLSSRVAPEGKPANCGRYPLIVFSHGFGGCGTQSIFFTEELARHGYVVAAPDHKDGLCSVDGRRAIRFITPDETFSRPDRWTETTHANRKTDLQLAVRWVLDSSELRSQIDPERLGAVGHSLGGYTVLGLAGGWKSWKDDRIKAVLAFSPYAAPFLVDERLASVNVPVMYQAADKDLLITPSAVRAASLASNPPKYYAQLRNGTHFEWTNLLCIGAGTISRCLDSRPNARLINTYGIAFLDGYLKGQRQPLERLDGSGLDDYKQMSR